MRTTTQLRRGRVLCARAQRVCSGAVFTGGRGRVAQPGQRAREQEVTEAGRRVEVDRLAEVDNSGVVAAGVDQGETA